MYAIFDDGGKQYKVSAGDTVLVETRELPEGQTELVFDKVLMIGEGADARIGTPWVTGATVTAQILEHLRTAKVRGTKHRRRKGYIKRWGHRQNMLKVQVGEIHA